MKGKWKPNSKKKKKGNAVLQKYMSAVGEFVKSKSGTEEAGHDHVVRFVKKKSRKELRKEKRKLKKARMKSHYEGNKTLSVPSLECENPSDKQPQVPKKKKKMEKVKEVSKTNANLSAPVKKAVNSKIPPPSSKKGKKVNKLQESRKMALQEANEQEDREIKKLERCLGLNKRKNKKSLPQSFVVDGLDYILGVLDSGSSAGAVYDDDDDMDVAKANFEKLDENDSEVSDEDDEPGDETASEGSDADMGSVDDDEEEEDEMVDEEEAEEEDEVVDEEEEEVEDDQDEMNESDENEEESEEETEAPEKESSQSKPETVSWLKNKCTFIR